MTRNPFRYPFREEDRPNRIRYWRERRELTQERLAAQLDTTRATVNKWETGRHPLTVERLREIARVLRVPTADLLMPQDNPLTADEDARRIMEAWQSVPPRLRSEMAEAVVRTLTLVAKDSSAPPRPSRKE